MSEVRIMFVGQGPSGLPEDRVVNVFHFVGAGTYDADRENFVDQVELFYNGGTSPAPVASFISAWVSRAAQLIAYDMTTAKPRIPTVREFTLVAPNASGGLPEEVACCLSYMAAPPVTPRRRGRLFIGPLTTNAYDPGTASTASRPAASFVSSLISSAVALAEYGGLTNPGWSIRSSVATLPYSRIVQGYVDNALDTQRRRGPKTTARTLMFPA